MTSRIPVPMTALLVAVCLSPVFSQAQAIKFQQKAFIDAPALPFSAPAALNPVPAPIFAITTPVATPPATAPGAPAPPLVAAVSFEIEKGNSASRGMASSMPSGPVTTGSAYEVLATDRTIRGVLQRWAHASGWKHEQAHWTLLRDFPVQGTASSDFFKGDFKSVVRTLLASTQATDLPAQPCFYTNHIVRVVPQAELCDRTATNPQ